MSLAFHLWTERIHENSCTASTDRMFDGRETPSWLSVMAPRICQKYYPLKKLAIMKPYESSGSRILLISRTLKLFITTGSGLPIRVTTTSHQPIWSIGATHGLQEESLFITKQLQNQPMSTSPSLHQPSLTSPLLTIADPPVPVCFFQARSPPGPRTSRGSFLPSRSTAGSPTS